jgi:hypothetical protein
MSELRSLNQSISEQETVTATTYFIHERFTASFTTKHSFFNTRVINKSLAVAAIGAEFQYFYKGGGGEAAIA